MKRKIQRWVRNQLGCPKCRVEPVVRITNVSSTWPMRMSNGQSVTYTYRQQGDA